MRQRRKAIAGGLQDRKQRPAGHEQRKAARPAYSRQRRQAPIDQRRQHDRTRHHKAPEDHVVGAKSSEDAGARGGERDRSPERHHQPARITECRAWRRVSADADIFRDRRA